MTGQNSSPNAFNVTMSTTCFNCALNSFLQLADYEDY